MTDFTKELTDKAFLIIPDSIFQALKYSGMDMQHMRDLKPFEEVLLFTYALGRASVSIVTYEGKLNDRWVFINHIQGVSMRLSARQMRVNFFCRKWV